MGLILGRGNMKLSNLKKLFLAVPLLVLLVSCQTRQTTTASRQDGSQSPDLTLNGTFSTNWLAVAKAVLPEKLRAQPDLSFQSMTNALCRASLRGNNVAQGLWGFVLVVVGGSPKAGEDGLKLMRDSAGKGNVLVMVQLGFLYEGGKFVRIDYNETFHWFGLAAELGDAEAQLELGGCYHYGLGTTPDLVKAVECYRRSAEQTNYVAMKSLGYLLMNGMGADKDLVAAKYWLTRAANEGGNRRAMMNLGSIYSMDFPETNAMVEAFHWYKKSAELGDAAACYQLAPFYYYGWGGVETNVASFSYWRFQAATLGFTQAQYEMGVAYRVGDGVPKDPDNSLIWYRKAAAKNHPKAFYDLALRYLENKTNRESLLLANHYMFLAAQAGHREAQFQYALSCFRGDVGPVNYENGNLWLAKSAEAGWASAEYALSYMYCSGNTIVPGGPHCTIDRKEGIKWLRRAAGHENLQAEAMLGVMLIQGTEVKKDTIEAEKLLRHAAEHGYASAQGDLGFAIQDGDVSSTNLVEAAMWSQLAESNATDPNALKRIHVNLVQELTQLDTEQLVELHHRMENFKPLPVVQVDPMLPGWEKASSYQQEDGQFGH